MTFRVSCHTDSPNAVLFQNARFENFERTSKHATGLRGIARNNQNLADAGLSAQPAPPSRPIGVAPAAVVAAGTNRTTVVRIAGMGMIIAYLTSITLLPALLTVLNPAGTYTGRPTSAEAFYVPHSTNLHNLVAQEARRDALFAVRDVIIPDEGTVFTVRLPVRLAAAVRDHARASGRTVSAVVAQALEEFLGRAHGDRPGR